MGKTMETVTDFIFGGFKIIFGGPDGDWSHEIKRKIVRKKKLEEKLWPT